MKKLEIRTTDPVLHKALTLWWCDFSANCSEGHWILTDCDTEKPLGVPGEITLACSGEATLLRPLDFDKLEELFSEKYAKSARGLIFTEKKIFFNGEALHLTPLEERLLRLLYEAAEPISSEELALKLWGEKRSSNQINVYINYLRKKLGGEGKEQPIRTMRRKGFYIKND